MKLLRLLFLSLAVCGVAISAAPAEPWQAHLDRGREALTDGDLAIAAKELATAAGHANPPNDDLADAFGQLGFAWEGAGDFPSAKDAWVRGVSVRERVHGAESLPVADDLIGLGHACSDAEAFAEGEKALRRALAIRRAHLAANDPAIAEIQGQLAWLLQAAGRHAEAVLEMGRSLAVSREAFGASSLEFADALEEAAPFYANEDGSFELGARYRALNIRERAWGTTDPRFLEALLDLAEIHRDRNELPAARALWRMVLFYHELGLRNRQGGAIRQAARAYLAIADDARDEGRFDRAEANYQLAAQMLRGQPPDSQLAEIYAALGQFREEMGAVRDALSYYKRALEIRQSSEDENPEAEMELVARLAVASQLAQDDQGAERYFRDYEALERDQTGDASIGTAQVALEMGKTYRRMRLYTAAIEKLERALAIFRQEHADSASGRAETIQLLTELYLMQGRDRDANGLTFEAIRLFGEEKAPILRDWLDRPLFWVGFIMTAVAGLVGLILLAFFANRRVGRLAGAPVLATPGGGVLAMPGLVAPSLSEPRIDAGSPSSAHLTFHGSGGAILRIEMENLLRSLATLGVYYFWGKARARRYLFTAMEFAGDRFAFHGTGGEMFRGWLRAAPVLAFLAFFPTVLPWLWNSKNAYLVGPYSVAALLAVVWPLARAGAFRYRLRRTSWRGIRFNFVGNGWQFSALWLGWAALAAGTVGFAYPVLSVRTRRYLVRNARFGNLPFQFTGRARDLAASYLAAMPLTILTLGLYWFWWSALEERYFWARTALGATRFRCTVRGTALARLRLGNLALLLLTVGLAWPWITARKARFWARHISVEGPPAWESARQELSAADAAAEGFADYLGFDFGL